MNNQVLLKGIVDLMDISTHGEGCMSTSWIHGVYEVLRSRPLPLYLRSFLASFKIKLDSAIDLLGPKLSWLDASVSAHCPIYLDVDLTCRQRIDLEIYRVSLLTPASPSQRAR